MSQCPTGFDLYCFHRGDGPLTLASFADETALRLIVMRKEILS